MLAARSSADERLLRHVPEFLPDHAARRGVQSVSSVCHRQWVSQGYFTLVAGR